MKSPQPMQTILYHEYWSIERSRSKEISFSQHLSHNALLITYFLQRLCSTVALKKSSTLYAILSTSQYMCNHSVLYKYPKISQIRLSSNPRDFDIFWSIKLKPRRCTSAIYILSLCEVSEP